MGHYLRSTLTILALAVLAAPVAGQAQGKIGYVDSQRIMAQAPGADSASQAFEQAMAGYRQQLAPLEEELQRLSSEYEQQQSLMTPERRRQQEATIRQKQQEYQQKAQDLQQQAQQRRQELMQPIMQKIEAVLESIRQEQGYIMIFDAANSGLIAADPALDLTEQVLQRLQAAASGTQ